MLDSHRKKEVYRIYLSNVWFTWLWVGPKTDKTASKMETNKVKKERYLIREDNTIFKFYTKLSF